MKTSKNHQLANEMTDFCMKRLQTSAKKTKESKPVILAIITALLSIGARPLAGAKSSTWFAE